MKFNIRIVAVLFAAALLMGVLAGCGQNNGSAGEASPEKDPSGGLSVVATIFPEYDWVMNVLGDKADEAEVTLLLDNKVDLHSYQPTADDLMKIATCDVFIYVGGESDECVEDALEGAVNKNMKVICLMDVLGNRAKEEEVVEGMQESEHEHDDDHDADHDEAEDHDEDEDHDADEDHDHDEPEYDEHVWLSVKNAEVIVDSIGSTLAEADPENAEEYSKNAADYITALNDLDGRYSEAVKAAKTRTVLFGDRFPFRYLTDDYGLDYYAAFVGCSAETEASFETITFLADKVDELGLKYVFTIDGSDQSIAKTIIQNTASKDQQILTLDSMQTMSAEEIKKGKTYLDIMESNLAVLEEAVG